MQSIDTLFNSNQFNLTDIIREISSDINHMRPSSSATQQNYLPASSQLNLKSQIDSAFNPRKEISIGSEWNLRSNILGQNDSNVVYASAYPHAVQIISKSPEDFITTNPIDFDKELKEIAYVEDDHSPESHSLSKNSKKIQKLEKQKSPESLKLKDEKGKGKKHPWQPAEDAKVLELLGCYGQSWALIAAALGNRTGKQVRDRYLNYLRPDIKDEDFTLQEDRLLLALYYQMGHKWSRIASHMAGRTECQVKNRFYAHIKKRLMFPDFNAKNMAQANNIAAALFESDNLHKQENGFKEEVAVRHTEKKEEFLAACQIVQSSPEEQPYHIMTSKPTEVTFFDGQNGNMMVTAQSTQNNGNSFSFAGHGQNLPNQPFLNKATSHDSHASYSDIAALNKNNSLDISQKSGQTQNEQAHAQALLSLENELINRDKMKRYEELVRRKNALEFFYTKTLQEMNDLRNMDFGIPNMM